MKREQKWKDLIQDEGDRGDARLFPMNAFKNEGKNFESFKNISVLDPVLSEVVCRWFMPPVDNATCCDPFAGDTTFGFVSSYLGAQFTGIELRQKQVDFNTERVQEHGLSARYICDDGRNIKDHLQEGSQDLMFSCPPYFDLEKYSDLENDASNQETYEDFYAIVDEALSNAVDCLKDNRFAVVVAEDIRNKETGEYYNFLNDIIGTMQRKGLIFYNELILIDPIGTAAVRARRYMRNRKVAKVHQNVLVFYKGDPHAIQGYFPEIAYTGGEDSFDYGSEDV